MKREQGILPNTGKWMAPSVRGGTVSTVAAACALLVCSLLALAPSALADTTGGLFPPPAPNPPPSISGNTLEGSTLTGDNGDWAGEGTVVSPSFTYSWFRCDAVGPNCDASPVSAGPTATTYDLTAADIGHRIKFRVRATTGGGNFRETDSQPTAVIEARPPVNTAPPTISGTARLGEVLTGSNGTWTGTEPITYARQWRRCNSAVSSCTDIPGATSATYTLGSADAGRRLTLRVIGTNTADTDTAFSDLTGVIKAPPIPRLGVSDTSPEAGQRVIFSSTSGDPDGGPVTVEWDFDGDGFDDGTDPRLGHTFTSAGTKTVRLRVTDDENEVSQTSRSVSVRARPAVVTPPRFDDPGTDAPTTPLTPTAPTQPARPAFIRPFPIVRIAGRGTRRGARITLLAVRAPRGSLVRVRCKGGKRRGCKYKRARKRVGRSGRVRIKGLQRRLRAGAVIEITVSKSGEIGKFTRFRVRRRKAPLRRDLCVAPGASKPTKCEGL